MNGARLRAIVRRALAASAAALVRCDPELRGDADEEAVHDARVAVRRLRSDLRAFRAMLADGWADGVREHLAWLQDGLSSARDADVLIAGVRADAGALPDADRAHVDAVLAPLFAARAAAYARVASMLDEPRHAELRRELARAATGPPFAGGHGARGADALRRVVRRAWKTLRKRVRARTRPPTDGDLHRIRIAAKGLRYAAESVAAALPRARRLARAAERMQTILGTAHDAAVASDQLRSLGEAAERAFLAGELAVLANARARAARAAWRAAWRDARRARRRFERAC